MALKTTSTFHVFQEATAAQTAPSLALERITLPTKSSKSNLLGNYKSITTKSVHWSPYSQQISISHDGKPASRDETCVQLE